MNAASYPAAYFLRISSRKFIQPSLRSRSALRRGLLGTSRCFHRCDKRLATEVATEGNGTIYSINSDFWKEYKKTFDAPSSDFRFEPIHSSDIGREFTAVGYLTNVKSLGTGNSLCFANIESASGLEQVQILSQDPDLCKMIKGIRLNTPISVSGTLEVKHKRKNGQAVDQEPVDGLYPLSGVNLRVTGLTCLNSIAPEILFNSQNKYPAQSRHLQIRYDSELRKRLKFRSDMTQYIRGVLQQWDFQEVETPILFKSTAEGAREFLVPTRKIGHAYALPQSPQQYKQVLMASGIRKYFQFAKCFRDEDLRVDRQPEFTQIDLEMAFAHGEIVMQRVEALIKSLYERDTQIENPISDSLNDASEPFPRIPYQVAMSKYGSDKPDLRIETSIHRIEHIVPEDLRRMITKIQDPIIEVCKFSLKCNPRQAQEFIHQFMESPAGEPFRNNIDGAPGICIYDLRKPVNGFQIFGFEGAEKLQEFYNSIPQLAFESDKTWQDQRSFREGDLFMLQARPNLPHSGGSTVLGKLRLAIYKAALEQRILMPSSKHNFLWVTEFPMFTLNNDTDPGQGGSAGFSATHHPFTAPMSAADVDMLLADPLKAKADHYDLVVNGVELGGGSRRIHNADMQKFIMKDILKMPEDRISDFSHLFDALASGCPPHAGFALGFDRLIAVMTGVESVKDVIAFPKNSKGEDMMVRSPAILTDAELRDYGLQLKK